MNGSCLCGNVRWSTETPLRSILECHCHRCQKTTGNYMAATAAPTETVEIDGASLRWFSPDDDPNVAYGFCAMCGASMFHRSGVVDGTNRHTSICAGSIDGPSALRTIEVWFADEAADHVRLDRSLPTFPGHP